MADTPLILKRFNGSTYDKLHPETTWTQVLNKPSTFTPTAHTHTLSDITDSGAAAAYGVVDSASPTAISTGTSLTTERDVYYGLVAVNGSSQTRATTIYAPTSAGTTGQVLTSTGGVPTWQNATSGGWTSLYSGGPTIVTASTATWTAFALGYTPSSGDIFALKVSYGSTSSSIEKAICFVEYGTFSSTTGMSIVGFFGYGGVSGTTVVGWNIGAQWQISGTNLQLRYPTYSAWNSTTLVAATSFYVWEIWKVN